jgi:UDP-N-acetyl-2-amino-2-deoxyglucuronate dehydrogenase
MSNFALIGAAGYIAPRHMQAIRDTGHNLVAALDTFDSVGIIDSYFPQADFFTEFERFDRHIDKLRRNGLKIDYVSICSPNYLHDAHIRFALRNQAHAICEKPLVLNPWNVAALEQIEKETGKQVYTILQLRLHPSIIELKKRIEASPKGSKHEIDLTYITSRGKWYHHSWKGEDAKSGGIATNIGIHFFDMLLWIFGNVAENKILGISDDTASGVLMLEKARVSWFLSIDAEHLPVQAREKGGRTYRSLKIEGKEIEFSDGFTDLHTKSYAEILNGRGYGLKDALPSIEVVHSMRQPN